MKQQETIIMTDVKEKREWVDDAWENHLGWDDEIPTPKYFKFPQRCHIVRNLDYGRKEWRQYMGAGHTCIPEKKEK